MIYRVDINWENMSWNSVVSFAAFWEPAITCMAWYRRRRDYAQHRGMLWNVSLSNQCKHYQKPTTSYHFGEKALLGNTDRGWERKFCKWGLKKTVCSRRGRVPDVFKDQGCKIFSQPEVSNSFPKRCHFPMPTGRNQTPLTKHCASCNAWNLLTGCATIKAYTSV